MSHSESTYKIHWRPFPYRTFRRGESLTLFILAYLGLLETVWAFVYRKPAVGDNDWAQRFGIHGFATSKGQTSKQNMIHVSTTGAPRSKSRAHKPDYPVDIEASCKPLALPDTHKAGRAQLPSPGLSSPGRPMKTPAILEATRPTTWLQPPGSLWCWPEQNEQLWF